MVDVAYLELIVWNPFCIHKIPKDVPVIIDVNLVKYSQVKKGSNMSSKTSKSSAPVTAKPHSFIFWWKKFFGELGIKYHLALIEKRRIKDMRDLIHSIPTNVP